MGYILRYPLKSHKIKPIGKFINSFRYRNSMDTLLTNSNLIPYEDKPNLIELNKMGEIADGSKDLFI